MTELTTVVIGIVTTLLTGAVGWIFKTITKHSIKIAQNETRLDLMETNITDRFDRLESKIDRLIESN